MSAPADRPLSALDSLRGLLAAFRLLDEQIGIDLDATTIRVMVAGGGEELAAISLDDLIRHADAAVASEALWSNYRDTPGAHSPLPWSLSAVGDDPYTLFDDVGTPIIAAIRAHVPDEEAVATIDFVRRAANALPLSMGVIHAAVLALRSYQKGNSAPDLAKGIADACEAAMAELKARR